MGGLLTSRVQVIPPPEAAVDDEAQRDDSARADGPPRSRSPRGSMDERASLTSSTGSTVSERASVNEKPLKDKPSDNSRTSSGLPHTGRLRSVEDLNKPRLQISANGGYELIDNLGHKKQLQDDVVTWLTKRNTDTLQGSIAFVPWILQQSFYESGLDESKVLIHRGTGAVVFSDASGFTALTERLAKKDNGAEMLSQCLQAFFTPLIDLINAYRGDVIKFSGDALTIYFPAVDDTQGPRQKLQMPPHGSYGLPDLGPFATAVLRACACCIEIHKKLNLFDTGVDGVRLCLHIGIGCGDVTILQVGGVVPPETHVPRFEYLIAGPPIEQISIAEPLAKNGETCVSPQAWEHVKDCCVENTGRELERPDFHLLLKMDETKYTFPCIKFCAMERDFRHKKQFRLSELNIIRRYIPSAVFKQIEGGTLTYVNEMRNISTIFISGSGVDVSAEGNDQVAQDLMTSIQRICYAGEGTLNKFVIDDKGMLFLLVFGLPPLVHTDDPTRAVLACFEMLKVFKRLKVETRMGVTTGRAYCGVCGSPSRMEYTVLGDIVNLSARLMGNAPKDGILVDEETTRLSTREVEYDALSPIKVKGKTNAIPIFQPRLRLAPATVGIKVTGGIHFPWYERPLSMPRGGSECFQTPEALEQQFKVNVSQLCGMPGWAGIKKIHGLLGGTAATLPPNSPFKDGGVIIIEGPTGMGKIELAEYMVAHVGSHLQMLPVCASIGPRLNDIERLGVELLRSIVGVFRHLDKSLPLDDLEALSKICPEDRMPEMVEVREAFEGNVVEERREALLQSLIGLAVSLLEIIRRETAIIVVMQLEYGTSLFSKTLDGFSCFWAALATLTRLAMYGSTSDLQPSPSPSSAPRRNASDGMMTPVEVPALIGTAPNLSGDAKPIVVVALAKEADRSSSAVKLAMNKGWFVEVKSLSESGCLEYAARYLDVPKDKVPRALRHFVAKISLGNPLYIRETIDQLRDHDQLKVERNSDGDVDIQYERDLDAINIVGWSQTAMVGETVCLLESLEPLQAAVLKMSTVFKHNFTLQDLASSSCSRWAGATHFDYLRLFRALQDLVKRNIIEVVRDHNGRSATDLTENEKAESQGVPRQRTFAMKNVLIRKVGSSMVLEGQKKVVKRQALIDRALAKALPARMEVVKAKKMETHIPWYYESVLA